MELGVLALQGDFEAHAARFSHLGVSFRWVRRPQELEGLDGLVLPGGESTTILSFLSKGGFLERLERRARTCPVFSTCAGTILLAREVTNPSQPSLGLLDISIERNGFGRQVASFVDRIRVPLLGNEPIEAVFIRAPRIRSVGPGVEVLGRWRDEPVLVRQGSIVAATFHPELTSDDRLARYFLEFVVPKKTPGVPTSLGTGSGAAAERGQRCAEL